MSFMEKTHCPRWKRHIVLLGKDTLSFLEKKTHCPLWKKRIVLFGKDSLSSWERTRCPLWTRHIVFWENDAILSFFLRKNYEGVPFILFLTVATLGPHCCKLLNALCSSCNRALGESGTSDASDLFLEVAKPGSFTDAFPSDQACAAHWDAIIPMT